MASHSIDGRADRLRCYAKGSMPCKTECLLILQEWSHDQMGKLHAVQCSRVRSKALKAVLAQSWASRLLCVAPIVSTPA